MTTKDEGGLARQPNASIKYLPQKKMYDTLSNMLKPRLDTLPAAQQALWPELSATPKAFTLYGGTAIALRIGHRVSVDFDFFSQEPFSPITLHRSVPYLAGGVLQQSAPNTLTVRVERGGPVQVSFFGALGLGQVEPHEVVEGPQFQVASLVDLSGMKAATVTQRVEAKDYIDIHALLTQAKIPLEVMLSAAHIIYGDEASTLLMLKAISYHEEPALASLAKGMRQDLVNAVRAVDVTRLPALDAVRARKPRS